MLIDKATLSHRELDPLCPQGRGDLIQGGVRGESPKLATPIWGLTPRQLRCQGEP